MSSRLLRRVAVMAGALLALSLGSFLVRDERTAEPTMDEGQKGHQMMKAQSRPPAHTPSQATPKGWRFSLPPGNPDAGRLAFIAFECLRCHAVQDERLPAPKADHGGVGPALTGMGPMHPAEYFAEAIINPNASVAWRITHHKEEQKGYLGADGKSKMPNYNGEMTVQQLIDLVAYLRSLTAPGEHKH